MKKGKLFVLEGIDGSGKTSLAEKLKGGSSMGGDSEPYVSFEPGGSNFGIKMRKLLLDPQSKVENARALFLGFWSGRASHIDQVIIPKINEGKNIVCDRMDGSTFAFQLHGQENQDLEPLFWLLRDYIMCEIDPHYIYLRISVETSEKRMLERQKQKKEQGNHFDLRPKEFHQRVKAGYEKFFDDSRLARKVYIVDAEKNMDDVYAEVSGYIKKITTA